MPVFREEANTLAYMIDATAKKFRNDNGQYWTSNILPTHSVGTITVRAADTQGQTDHQCWASFEVREIVRGSEVSASFCNNSHQSFKLSEHVIGQLTQIYSGTGSETEVTTHEIDAIMSGWLQDESTSLGESKPAAQTEVEAPAAGVEPVGLIPTNTILLDALRTALNRTAQLERGLRETNTAVRRIQQNMQTTNGNVHVVGGRVKGILTNLKATLGYRAKTTYVCASCHSKGKVAVRVKCTHCGEDNWWGWW